METKNQEVQTFDGEKYVTKIFGYDANGSMVEEVISIEYPAEPHHNID